MRSYVTGLSSNKELSLYTAEILSPIRLTGLLFRHLPMQRIFFFSVPVQLCGFLIHLFSSCGHFWMIIVTCLKLLASSVL